MLIKEENESVVDLLTEVPWIFKYIKYGELMFDEFTEFTRELMQEIIADLQLPPNEQRYPMREVKRGVGCCEVSDVEVMIATIELVSSS
jgi:hypothetical protein